MTQHSISVRAVLIGGAVDIAGSTIVSNLFFAIWLRVSTAQDLPAAPAYAELIHSPAFQVCALLVGGLFSLLGGATAAWLVKTRHVLHGALTAIPCLFIEVVQLILPMAGPIPGTFVPASLIVAVLAASSGGYLVKRYERAAA